MNIELNNSNATQENKWCVYVHTNKTNNKKYVGITSKDPPSLRWENGFGYRRNKHFWSAIEKYGWNGFRHDIVLSNETFEYACKAEKCLISAYKSNQREFGYNNTSGGDGNFEFSCEVLLKMQKHAKKRFSVPENNIMYGKKHTQETKNKISNSRKNYTKERHPNIRPVYCKELDEYFWGAREAQDKYGFNHGNIAACCNGKLKHTGRHPITGQLLSWEYISKECYLHLNKKIN